MTVPWNRWFHCIGGTYGSWLPGDPRGFRTRHHREHVDGDYKNPPPEGLYAQRHRRAKEALRYEPVTLSITDRPIVCMAMGSKLIQYGVELIELAVGGKHFHALCRFPLELPPRPDGSPRSMPGNLLADGRDPVGNHILGRAKRSASVKLFQIGRKEQGRPLWATKSKLEPVQDRAHQLAVLRYTRRHANEQATLWTDVS